MQLLDVPYVPQSGALCGGAALAMVLRYWGRTGVLAEDFAALLEPDKVGIRTGTLVKIVETSGWTALPMAGTPAEIERQLVRGRPVIALIQAGSDSYHYVVIVAWANGWVIIHDPNVGPFRAIHEGEFDRAWSGCERWALLILPPSGADRQGGRGLAATAAPSLGVPDPMAAAPRSPGAPDRTPAALRSSGAPNLIPAAPASPGALGRCGALVEAGILLAKQGDTAEAELRFATAQSSCPTSAAPLRERAGLRFQAEDWVGASRLAEHALALDPNDADTWRLLAGSRFLAGDVEGALGAWNHVAEPRTDLTRVDGLNRVRFSAVAGQLSLPPGRLLTPHAFRRARRRLAEMPAQSDFRLSLRPLADGIAQVNVTLLERPLVLNGMRDAGSTGIKAITGREISIDVASPTGNGELWTAGWRWWKDRPRVSLALAVPGAGGRPGIWRLHGSWERQAYAAQALLGSGGAIPANVNREERRRTSLSFSDWFGPDFRLEIAAALDEWVDRGVHFSLHGSAETRWARDRLALRADWATWTSLKSSPPFEAGGLSAEWSSSGQEQCDAWLGGLGLSSTTSEAPLALWSGAGTGNGRGPLLRAHPLLDAGVIQGRVFGRTLVHGTIERQAWPWKPGPLRLGWALFVDAAKPWDTGRTSRVPWQVDGGMGLRLRSLGMKGTLRIDAARGFEDGNSAVSVGWQVP